MQKVHLWMGISADCPNRGRRSLTKIDSLRNVQSSVWALQQILPDETIYHNTSSKSPRGQSLCKKSTSGWTVANVFYGVGRSPKRQKYVQLLSRTACGRCNRYCLMKLSITTLLPNHPEGNLFAESPPLDGDFCWLSQSWQTQSDKDGQARKCPEQRVDAATDIARQIALFFTLDQIYLSPSKPIFSSAPCNLPLNNHL